MSNVPCIDTVVKHYILVINACNRIYLTFLNDYDISNSHLC